MLSRWYGAATLALTVVFLAVPSALSFWPFMAATLLAIPAVAIGIQRVPRAARLPWRFLLAAVIVLNAGNVLWIWYTQVLGRATGDGTLADGFYSTAYALVFCAAVVVVLRRGRRDLGGVLDAVITSVALGALMWDVVFFPFLAGHATPMARQVALFADVFLMMGILGALLRVAIVSRQRIVAVYLFVVALAAGLVATVVVTLFADPVTHVRPDWTNVPFLLAYAALGCAALHPSAEFVTTPGPTPRDDLSTTRLMVLGAMVAVVPVVGGGRVVLGLPADGLLIALGSAIVVPLAMLRVARLAAQRRRAEAELLRLATADPLTGLPNRAACLARLEAGRDGMSVLFCDLDGFKPVNDRLGHAAGDAVLIEIAARLRGCVREDDMVSRFGGDEFVVVCRTADVTAVRDRIRAAVAEPIAVAGSEVRLGVSVGVAAAGPQDSVDQVIGRADLAMYEVKHARVQNETPVLSARAAPQS